MSRMPHDYSRVSHFSKDQVVYFQGDSVSSSYAVTAGVARTCRYRSDGQRQITGFYYPGDVFGIDGDFYLESAEAVSDLSCLCLKRHAGGVSDYDPEWNIERLLRQALDGANRSIFLFGQRTALERLAAFILTTAERVGEFNSLNLAMCRTDIADYLGLTIHTVSRTISQLCSHKLIALDGPHHCRILDLRGIRALAGEDT